jgi:hypothetical protein
LYDIFAFDANIAYTITYGTPLTGRGIFKTVDGGKNWTRTTNAFFETGTFPGGIHFFNQKEGLAFGDPLGGYFEIYRTADSGRTWTQVPSPQIPPPLTEEAAYVGSLPFACHTDSVYWFATIKGRLLRSVDYMTGTTAKRTTNGGVTWEPVKVPSRPSTDEVYSIPGTAGGYVIASPYTGYMGKMYTSNNGATWSVWDTLSSSCTIFSSISIGWSTRPGSNSIWKYNGLPLAVQDLKADVVSDYALDQDYPNPFNPGTDIGFRTTAFGSVKLAVYDLLGREVAVLVKDEKPAGSSSVRWEARNMPSGVYFCRLTAGSFSRTRPRER